MSAEPISSIQPQNLGQLLRRIGGVPPERVRMRPYPGTATEADLLRAEKPLCELVNGVLIDKPMGYSESCLAASLIGYIRIYLGSNPIGSVAGEGGMLRLRPGLVRVPDV